MEGMTITDFLLARIDEDEASVITMDCTCGHRDNNARPLANCPERVLAECEAKRRIVEDWSSLSERRDGQGRPLHLFDPVTSMLLKATEPWIRALALPYADHPDYDEAWSI